VGATSLLVWNSTVVFVSDYQFVSVLYFFDVVSERFSSGIELEGFDSSGVYVMNANNYLFVFHYDLLNTSYGTVDLFDLKTYYRFPSQSTQLWYAGTTAIATNDLFFIGNCEVNGISVFNTTSGCWSTMTLPYVVNVSGAGKMFSATVGNHIAFAGVPWYWDQLASSFQLSNLPLNHTNNCISMVEVSPPVFTSPPVASTPLSQSPNLFQQSPTSGSIGGPSQSPNALPAQSPTSGSIGGPSQSPNVLPVQSPTSGSIGGSSSSVSLSPTAVCGDGVLNLGETCDGGTFCSQCHCPVGYGPDGKVPPGCAIAQVSNARSVAAFSAVSLFLLFIHFPVRPNQYP